jgi:hypothetical protein
MFFFFYKKISAKNQFAKVAARIAFNKPLISVLKTKPYLKTMRNFLNGG